METYEFQREKLKLMLYGQPGSHKTRLSATAAMDPRLAPALMLQAFGNPISIRDYDKKPDIITLQEMEDFNDPYQWILDGQPKDADFATTFNLHPPYKTLIVDGLTEVQRFVTRKVTGVDRTDPGNLTARLDRQGFGMLLGTMLNWAIHYTQLDLNIIITSLEHTREVQGEATYYKPLLWGQSGMEICGYMYMVMRLVPARAADLSLYNSPVDPLTDETKFVGLLQPTTRYYAKDQYGINVDHICDPTMTKVADLLEQSGQPIS